MRCSWLLAPLVGVLAPGCDKGEPQDPSAKKTDEGSATVKVAGVYPEQFECASIATPEALGEVLGAPTRALDSAASGSRGVARPCRYEVAAATPEYWTFDFDCRPDYKKRADALFEQYRQINADRIEQYNAVSDAGVKAPNDAGVEYKAPGTATEVAVGAKALDHNDQGVLFIDDDAPCYVRVIGPDATRRLELARLVAKKLTFQNAPMTPRPLK